MDIDFKNLFQGVWTFKRMVKGLFPEGVEIDGKALFRDISPTQRRYEEVGIYVLNAQEIPFQQSYLYDVTSRHHCKIMFPDGRLFYELSKLEQNIEHVCGEDHYQGVFKVTSHSSWELSWNVSGPRKKYQMITHYKAS